MEDKVTLYIATHNKTGKKYFGKTVRWFTQEDLQNNYHGSGKYWNKHKKKHGERDITMEIYKICSLDESDEDYVKPIALKFSEENNIVESNEWANLIVEDGLDGNIKGNKHTEETKEKMSLSLSGRVFSEEHIEKLKISAKNKPPVTPETKQKMSIAKTGENHYLFGKKHSEETKQKMSLASKGVGNSMFDKKHSEETKQKMRKPKPQRYITCPHCGKNGGTSNMKRYHFDNCKSKI